MSDLLTEWLGAVNQPVVNSIQGNLDFLVKLVSDNGNFTEDQCKDILIEIIKSKPPKKNGKRER